MNDGRCTSVASISQDNFYRDLTPDQLVLAKKSEYNFDHPDTIDDDEIYRERRQIIDQKLIEPANN